MKLRLSFILLLITVLFCYGCEKKKPTLLRKIQTREEAQSTIKEIEQLETEVNHFEELEAMERELEQLHQMESSAEPS